jgi:hypothetical protein
MNEKFQSPRAKGQTNSKVENFLSLAFGNWPLRYSPEVKG